MKYVRLKGGGNVGIATRFDWVNCRATVLFEHGYADCSIDILEPYNPRSVFRKAVKVLGRLAVEDIAIDPLKPWEFENLTRGGTK